MHYAWQWKMKFLEEVGNKMEAIILAGGFGTRLQPVIKDVPKPMAPVAGRPFLEYILDQICAYGISKAILAVGYKYEAIQNYLGSSYKGLALEYSVETTPLLTGGAIKNALSYCKGDTAMVLNGDTFFQVDFAKMLSFHAERQSVLTMAVKEMRQFDRYGTVKFDARGRVTGFTEKKFCSRGFINGGVYLFNKNVFSGFPSTSFMLEQDYMGKYYKEKSFWAFASDGYFIDIGIPQDYERANSEFFKLKGK
jgi:D-glycero-alpha-D-manno-heptose 1-phosphate guanylyltransferase